MTSMVKPIATARCWTAFLALAVIVILTTAGGSVAQEAREQATQETDALPAAGADVAGNGVAESVAENGVAAGPAVDGPLLSPMVILAIVVSLFVVPMFLGGYFAKSLRMPDYGWKFALAIGTLAAAAVTIVEGEIKFGPDLSGGITLIYELQDQNIAEEDGEESGDRSSGAKRQLVRQLIGALSERVDPSGTKEVTIREYGVGQIEIIIPKATQQDLDQIERRIYTAGALEFRITASPVFTKNRRIIELAEALPPGENEVRIDGVKVAEWMAYKVDQFGPVDVKDPHLVKRPAGNISQALVLTNDGLDVTGKYLKRSSVGVGPQGKPEVRFTFDQKGAFLFGQLTGRHTENASGEKYQLGIILDKKLLSAPNINEKIKSSGSISGIDDKADVEFLVGILNAGSLPASLNKDPISRENISPTLGAETVQKGKTAILYSLAAVMVFILIYYRFAGMVACLALAANLLLILGLMVLFKAAFTLPGLAGLVLTIGMSVDANVLIFERIREERRRGSALRMAIRNGFGRATQTIVDANVTTLITAIVIYKIAPDNVKGFGVTLIIGIVMSMYAAIFLSRLVFDIAEKTHRISELRMMQVIGQTSFDFLSKRLLASVVSIVLIVVGLVAVADRGADLLNIDFTGGSSVTMVLRQDQSMGYAEVKAVLEGREEFAEKNLSLVAVGDANTQYTVSCIEQDVEKVQQALQEAFGDRLQTYHVEASEIVSLPAETKASDSDTAASDPFAGGTSARLDFGGPGSEEGIGYDAVHQLVQDALDATEHSGAAMSISHPEYQPGSARRLVQWDVQLALSQDQAREVFEQLEKVTNSEPVFPLANKIGGRVAGDMKTTAIASIAISLIGIVAYIWFRFQRVMYGLAAVVALVHDVLVTLGMIALSGLVVSNFPGLADALMIEKFQISLPIVAAFLTIIGYSLNDTIVVFDRIREVKGKSPKLTAQTINTSINQTLSRTLLTSLTTLLSVVLLYVLGGDGIHGFAFSLVVGVVVGTYSSIFIASPALFWMSQRMEASLTNSGPRRA